MRPRGMSLWVRITALMALMLAFSAPASARSYHIRSFESTITVEQDGSATITESIRLNFRGQFNGIYRTIPVDYPGPRGSNYALFTEILAVEGDSGNELEYEDRISGGFRELKIYIPGAVDTDKTVKIRYRVLNGVRFFPDYAEWYWNVTGNDWEVPIDRAAATVELPSAAAAGLRAQGFTGVYGSKLQDVNVEINGSRVFIESSNPLPMRGGLTVDIYIPPGVLREPDPLKRARWFVRGNPIVLLPVFALLVMFGLWWLKGRDPDAGLSVAPQYEPPKNMTPAEVGALVDDSVDARDLTSTLVDLAVRRYIDIDETEEEGLLFKSKDYLFKLVRQRSQWSGLAPHELTLLNKLFPDTDERRLSSLKNTFYTTVPRLKKDILSALKSKGMYRLDPDMAMFWRIVGAVISAAPFVWLHMSGRAPVFQSPAYLGVAVVASLIIVWLFGRQLTAKTLAGVRAHVRIRGFQEFMDRVDRDRLKRMPPDTFEKFLPFAMALGVEERWAKAFEGIVQQPPQWYHGTGARPHFSPYVFSQALRSMSNTAHQTFVSAPRASSSGSGFSSGGGFSGGGFSGGGFGGGGGRAF